MSTRSGEAIEAIRARLGVTQEALATLLGMADGGSYLNKIIRGKRIAGDDLLDRLQRAAALSDEQLADLRKLRDEDRRARRRRPLHLVDPGVPEVTDAEVAQFVGAMKALGFTRAKIEALLATAGIPYYRPYQTAA